MAINGIALIPAAGHTVTRQVLSGELIEIGGREGIWEELYLVMAQRKRVNPIARDLLAKFNI